MTARSTIDNRSTELRRSPPTARHKGARRRLINHGSTKDERRTQEKDERQTQEESKADAFSKPKGFANGPDGPANPNEVREGHLRKPRR